MTAPARRAPPPPQGGGTLSGTPTAHANIYPVQRSSPSPASPVVYGTGSGHASPPVRHMAPAQAKGRRAFEFPPSSYGQPHQYNNSGGGGAAVLSEDADG